MPLEFKPLTDPEREFVMLNLGEDTAKLALKLHRKKDFDGQKLISQIAARQKAKGKLPDWYANPELFFPPPVSVEQASSQATAIYKASLANPGRQLVDLTLGMGVDTFYLSKKFQYVSGYEQNPELALITAYNLRVLGADHISVISEKGENAAEENADCVFVDPSRRDERKRKTVAFEDSSPNMLEILPAWVRRSPQIIVKASPIIDIDLAVKQLKYVSEIHVVGYQKECKEVVFVLDTAKPTEHPVIHAVVLDSDGSVQKQLSFTRLQETSIAPGYGDPSGYLYEPHPALMKAGGFRVMGRQFDMTEIAPNSHLYSSPAIRTDFPGRLFAIKGVVNASGFSWEEWLTEPKANLTLRNFPAEPHDLRKKWRLKEGGHDYLFATTLSSGRKVVIITERV